MSLTADEYLSHLAADSARFRDSLVGCAPDARVPSCPDWTAADLLWHLTEVHDFWTHVVATRPAPPKEYAEPARPDGYNALLDRFDATSAKLAEALAGASPVEAAWTWADDRTVGFVQRRMALEALVHRVDADQTVGRPIATDPALAADGVEEILHHFFGGAPPWGEFAPLPHLLKVEFTDAPDVVWVRIGQVSGTDPDGVEHHEDGLDVVPEEEVGADAQPDAVISAPADVLLLRLWRRGDGSAVQLAGDLSIVDHFRRATHFPIQ